MPAHLAAMAERRQSDLFCLKLGRFSPDKEITPAEQYVESTRSTKLNLKNK